MKFTGEQQNAIDLRGHNLLVSAAAGSGKTAVLVERIYKLLTGVEPVDADRLLVVTFTRAAAAQMKERIRKRLDEALDIDPENENLLRQEVLLQHARITTIDSFCSYIIRENFTSLDIDPQCRAADEGEIKLLSEDVLESTFEKLFEEDDAQFKKACDYFCFGVSLDTLKDHVRRLYTMSVSMPDPNEWLTKRPWKNIDFISGLFLLAKSSLEEMAQSLECVLNVCSLPGGPFSYADTIEAEADMLRRAAKADYDGYEALRSAILNFEFGKLKPIKKTDSVDERKKELVSKVRDGVKKSLKTLTEKYFRHDYDTLMTMDRASLEAIDALCDVTLRYAEELECEKRERNIIDFSDMEHLALNVLTAKELSENGETVYKPSVTALAYREYFAEVMIDEYQDSNLIQEILLNAVSKEGGLFMVGDVKQSIYRFRLARPEIFMEKLESYEKYKGDENAESHEAADDESLEAAADAKDQTVDKCSECDLEETHAHSASSVPLRVDLHMNFRSRSEVLDAANFIFKKIMASDLGGVAYDEDALLVKGADFDRADDYVCEVMIVEGKASEARNEAAHVAVRINELMSSLRIKDENADEKEALRPLKYSDIVILMRSTSGRDDIFRQVLEEYDIPVYVESKTGFFGAHEVQTVLNLLSVINNPLQDIPFVAVMHSPIGSFTDEELARVRVWGEEAEFDEKAGKGLKEETEFDEKKRVGLKEETKPYKKKSEELKEETDKPEREGEYFSELLTRFAGVTFDDEALSALAQKAHDFLELLAYFRGQARFLPVSRLLSEFFEKTGYAEYVCALPGGERRSTNLNMLLEMAKIYEDTCFKGLYRFIRYIDTLKKYEADEGEANVLNENSDVVRIMSIHKSKGLEFPVVFIAGMSKEFNLSDSKSAFVCDADLGPGAEYADTQKRMRFSTLRKNLISKAMRDAALGEELRILYVAMTRAKEKLIPVLSLNDAQETVIKTAAWGAYYGNVLSYSDRSSAKSYTDWVLRSVAALLSFIDFANALAGEGARNEDGSAGHENVGEGHEDVGAGHENSSAGDLLFKFELKTKEDLASSSEKKQSDLGSRLRKLDDAGSPAAAEEAEENEALGQLEEALSFKYPYGEYAKLFAKTTVTELKRAAFEDADEEGALNMYGGEEAGEQPEIPVPSFMRGEAGESTGAYENTATPESASAGESEASRVPDRRELIVNKKERAALRGTLYHRVMELMDGTLLSLGGKAAADDISSFLEKNEREGLIEPGLRSLVYLKDILTFLKSPLAARLNAAFENDALQREARFMLGVDAKELDASLPEGEQLLVQGIIDCYFEEDGELVIVDYKTDRVNDAATLIERYRVQLAYYKRALETLTGKKVKQTLIYSFALGKEISCNMDFASSRAFGPFDPYIISCN